MPATQDNLTCDIESAPNDAKGNQVRVVKCHGRLVTSTSGELKAIVRPLFPEGGRIVLDLGDVSYMDSAGLGALVALKVSAVNQGMCILEVANMTPRVLDLLRITNLIQILSPGQS